MGFYKVKKQVYSFQNIEPWPGVETYQWLDWKWQFRNSLKTQEEFSKNIQLTPDEEAGFLGLDIFRVQTTPYYFSLIDKNNPDCPVRKMVLPHCNELVSKHQQMLDPLGENKKNNRPCERLIHRYSDRALFLLTDLCSVYCRYCTRKHFTASDQVVATQKQVDEAVQYLKEHSGIKEVIFSGGDPLTVSNAKLEKIIQAIYDVPSVELIRIGSRMPVVCPMRIDDELISIFKEFKPIYFMTHFNHPQEITTQSAQALEKLVDNGIPVMNQMVLLNGINNHEAIIYALSRRLLSQRVKPYYMFQADPSMGTDHLRNSVEDSLQIQKALWGHTSGLAMPQYIVDIPDGGGKTAYVPNFETDRVNNIRHFKGWDGVEADYISPSQEEVQKPTYLQPYLDEWMRVKNKNQL